MRKLLKKVIHRTYRPLVQWYLSKERRYSHGNLKIKVRPGVFHPGFFYSSTFLLEYILENVDLKGRKLLELGCGTALISIAAVKKGAQVTASDISNRAIENARQNAIDNQVDIQIVLSDLFDDLPNTQFDIIIINPPYYKGNVKEEQDYAWYCGESMQYFKKLFMQLPKYTGKQSTDIYMVLSDECDLESVRNLVEKQSLRLNLVEKKRKGVEWNFIWQIKALSQNMH